MLQEEYTTMTTLLQEFEEWLKDAIDFNDVDRFGIGLLAAKAKLEELKKKYNVP